jgi:soluble epoxide hydrolase/lipid-phosphate phosphatase
MPHLSSLPPRQTFTSAANHKYSYVTLPPKPPTKPTLLLLHGFPSHTPDWINQITHFSTLGYGILAIDLLGYGLSSRPDDNHAYRLKAMSSSLMPLLDLLSLSSVVGVGHDFGATLLSRMVTYFPARFSAVVFLSVGPARPGSAFKVHEINRMTRAVLGYELLGYIPWIVEDGTSQGVLERNAESAMALMFCRERGVWERWFYPCGG